MMTTSRWFARYTSLALACTGLVTGCDGMIEVQQVVIVDQFSPDGRVVRSQLISNIRPTPKGLKKEKKTTRAFLADLAREICEDSRERGKRDGFKVLQCGYSALPDILGKLVSRAPVPRGQADGLMVFETKGSEATKKLVCNGKDCDFDLTRSGFSLQHLGFKLLPVACTYIIQTPFPIHKTNADVTFHQYNAAAWNCTAKEDTNSVLIEIDAAPQSRKGRR